MNVVCQNLCTCYSPNMEPRAMLWIFVSVSLVCKSVAFLPSHTGGLLPDTDYTLTDLTVEGILRVVAKYFEVSNQTRYNPGDLTNLHPLTSSSLFLEHYGECASWEKFDGAVKAIKDENIRVADVYSNKAIWHFNGNQIDEGNIKMNLIRGILLDQLTPGDENAPDYDVARVHCGQFLHMTQSFYSNTNWIELKILETQLGISGSYVQCPEDVNQCNDCTGGTAAIPESQDCMINLPNILCMASGYRSRQDVDKPVTGRTCSHGGINDESRLISATGGINKETSDQRLSPHHHLHGEAALAALQATEDFFYHPDTGLYKLIGESKFRKLLNLDVGTSLAFVVDTTASMSEEIAAVKDQIIEMVDSNKGTCFAASKYVIVPFNDPSFGPAFVTTDSDDVISYINGLSVYGGGDCPELVNSGLELGIQNSVKGTFVYVYTDDEDKDKDKVDDVKALIKEKDVQVSYMLTGFRACRSRRSKRATSIVSPSYVTIARVSGGEIYETDNEGIRDLSRVIQGNIRASQVTIVKIRSVHHDTFDVEFPVDSTIREVLVSVIGPLDNTSVAVTNPSGSEGTPSELGAAIFTSSSQQTVFSFKTTEPDSRGIWIITLQNADLTSEYQVTVSANSLLDFTFDLLEVDQSGTAYPIDGLPVKGAEVLMQIQISSSDMIRSVSGLRLHDPTGKETLYSGVLEPIAGRTQGMYISRITLPDKPFLVKVLGLDSEGLAFRRTQPSEVQVVEFKLEQSLENNTIEDIFPGGNGSFTFKVSNSGPDDTMTVNVSIGANRGSTNVTTEQVLQANVDPHTMVLSSGEKQHGVVTVIAAEDTPVGTSVKVTLSVSSSLSSVTNILSVDVTVFAIPVIIPKVLDETPPNCTVLDIEGGCKADQMSKNCHLHEWQVRFQATDDTVLTEIALDPEVGSTQALEYEEFSLQNGILLYTATCCCPKLNITVRDGNGNSAFCGQDYYTPVAGQIKEPVCNGPILNDSGLGLAAIVGIVIAIVVVVVIVIIIVIKVFKGREEK